MTFKIPKYKDRNIENQVPVLIQLLRPSDNKVSEAIPFQFQPNGFGNYFSNF